MNPLFDRNTGNTPTSDFSNMMSQFNQFKNSFNGNPKQIVMNMLQNGQMSQQQFNQLNSMAQQFMNMIGHK